VDARNRLAAGLIFFAACAAAGPPPPSSPNPLLGKAAPEFRRASVQGETIASATGHVMVVEFFARWCVPCQRRLPAVEKLRGDVSDVTFVGVSLDERIQDALVQVKAYHLGFPVILDVGRVLAGRFRVTELPAVIVVGKDGRVAWFGGPEQPEDALRRAVITAARSDSR
jgi:cytochrome c biogenesis protein CcmG, thiol:disulfide interchange protein DsbE